MSPNIVDKIVESKRKEVQRLHRQWELPALKAAAASAPHTRNFFTAVTRPSGKLLNVIAEVKRASPSAGVIRADFDPVAIARAYQAAGADALSVLTDAEFFQGSLDYLRAVRAAVALPCLRKDFILDPWQVYESRAAGADAILLIAAILPPGELMDLQILATELRMTVLIEVHTAGELLQLRSLVGFPHASYSLLGINNRDLSTFQVDVGTTLRLAELAGEGVPVVSESGIKTRQDTERLAQAGVRAVLIGQTLMQTGDVAACMNELVGPRKRP